MPSGESRSMPKRWCRVERHREQQGKPRGSEGILGIIEAIGEKLGIIEAIGEY